MLNVLVNELNIEDALRNFVPYVQFKKRENHPWGSDTFSKIAEACNFAKIILLNGRFSRFLSCTNSTKLRRASYIQKKILECISY